MSVTQYVGARYVPLFANPIDWDITKAYEPLTIVYYQGNSYTSKQSVPTGTDINNETYWALTGNYNAQIEQYRSEVVAAKTGADTANATNTTQDAQIAGTTDSGLKTLVNAEHTTNVTQDAQIAGTTDSGLKTLVTNESTARSTKDTALDAQLAGTADSGLKTLIDANTTANAEHTNQLAGTADSGLKAMIESNSEALKYDEHVVIFGDSYGVGTNSKASGTNGKSYIDYLKTLMPGWTITKFVNGGAGFFANGQASDTPALSGMNYNGFVSYAKSSMSEAERNAVGKVLFQGGCNDITNNNIGVFCTTISNARAAFPNAKIYVIFTYNGGLQMSKEYLQVIENYKNWGGYAGCCVGVTYNIPYVFNDSYDNIHPTEKQQEWLSKLMFNLLVYGNMHDYSAGDSSTFHINENHMLVIPAGSFTIPEYSASMQIAPPATIRKVNLQQFIPVIVPINSNLTGHYNDFEVVYASINTDGSITLNNFKDGYLMTGAKGYYIPTEVPIINY